MNDAPTHDRPRKAASDHELEAENQRLRREVAELRTQVNLDEQESLRERLAFVAERLERVVDSSGVGIFDWFDASEEEVFFSERFFTMLGIEEERNSTTRSEILSLLHPDDRVTAIEAVVACLRELSTVSAEVRFRTLKSGYRWTEVTGTATRDEETGRFRLTGGVRDVDSRKRLQMANSTLAETLNLVVAGARAGIYDWIDVRDPYLEVSDSLRDFLGYEESEVEHTVDFFFSIIHPADLPNVRALLERVFAGEADYDIEFRIRFKNKGYRWVQSTATCVLDPPNGAHRLIGSVIDVHERHVMVQRLEQLNTQLDRFAYLVAHDLRAPIRHIGHFAQVITEDYTHELNPEVLHHLSVIQSSAHDMEAMIQDLLEYSRTGTAKLDLAPVNLTQTVMRVREVLESQYEGESIDWRIGELPTVWADSAQMRMLFQNLLSNAIKFTRPGVRPRIRVDCVKRQDDCVDIEVQDNGVGFDPAHRDKLFEVFTRLHDASEYEGTGIGLANVARIVDRHHGSIRAEGEEGAGATFTVRLPALD